MFGNYSADYFTTLLLDTTRQIRVLKPLSCIAVDTSTSSQSKTGEEEYWNRVLMSLSLTFFELDRDCQSLSAMSR